MKRGWKLFSGGEWEIIEDEEEQKGKKIIFLLIVYDQRVYSKWELKWK